MPFTSETAKLHRGPGGRKKKTEVQRQQEVVQKAASEIAREYIERSVKPVMATYFQLAHGRLVNKWHEGQIVGEEFEADAPTTRHFVDKLLPEIVPNASERPIAIQVVVEGNSNGAAHAPAQSEGNGRPILAIGSNGGES